LAAALERVNTVFSLPPVTRSFDIFLALPVIKSIYICIRCFSRVSKGKDEKLREHELSNKELFDLYEQITKCEDTEFLQKVVDVIETTGLYTVAEKTFEFDLCSLEKNTLQQLQKCLGRR
jgi:hypothetical protein